MHFGSNAVLASLAGLLATTDALGINPRYTVEENKACPEIRKRFVESGSDKDLVVPGELAVQCLREMPFEKDRAVSFIKEYRKYLQYQSTIEILPKPPRHYPMPPTDLLGGLDDIQKKAASGFYKNQFDFDTALQDLVNSGYDGHLSLQLCSQQLFKWENETPLVSISSNGTTLPKVYAYEDALQLQSNNTRVSPVVSINGVDVVEYLGSLGKGSQDWDAMYNVQFLSLATSLTAFGESDVFNGTYTHSDVWPGAYHALRFANGSNSVVETTTTVKTFPFNNATAYYEYLCIPSNDTSSSSESSSNSTIPALKAPAGYPKPFSKDKWNRIMGFFPSSKGLEETAVLVVPTFDFTLEEQLLPNGEANFARVAREFIQNATSKGKKKMIVDLSGNGGGMVYAGMNLFKLFFPDQDIYSATRFRAHEGADIAGQAISSMPPEALNETLWLDWRNQFKPDQETGFESWKDLYGPNEVMGIQSSSLMASNISAASTSDEPVSGYGATKLDPAKPAFAAEDIILLTDGQCASTCTIFSELMKAQGVRTIAFGGRPENAPMQGIGGVKGAQMMKLSGMSTIMALVTSIVEEAVNSSEPIVATEDMEHFREIFPIALEDFPLTLLDGGVNLMNAFNPNNDHIPLQFKYEAAECRRFFTLDNIRKPETMWASAADAMFHGGDCVPGSTNGTGSLWPIPRGVL